MKHFHIGLLGHSIMLVIYSIVIISVLVAAIYDVAIQKIPNWISLAIILTGLFGNYFLSEGLDFIDGSAGIFTGLLLMLPGYVFASMGAGDVKLMAAIGGVVGFDSILDVVFFSYAAIFLMAVIFIFVKGDLVKLLLRYKMLFYGLFMGAFCYQKPDKSDAASHRLPLAPVIALSTFYVLYPKLCKSGLMADLCLY